MKKLELLRYNERGKKKNKTCLKVINTRKGAPTIKSIARRYALIINITFFNSSNWAPKTGAQLWLNMRNLSVAQTRKIHFSF